MQSFVSGCLRWDLAPGELRKDGVKVKPREQPFQVLVALIGAAEGVAPREELKEGVVASGHLD